MATRLRGSIEIAKTHALETLVPRDAGHHRVRPAGGVAIHPACAATWRRPAPAATRRHLTDPCHGNLPERQPPNLYDNRMDPIAVVRLLGRTRELAIAPGSTAPSEAGASDSITR